MSNAKAAALAGRMNARKDGRADHFGAAWHWEYSDGDVCEVCERTMFRPEAMLVSGSTFQCMCLGCAEHECEAAQR